MEKEPRKLKWLELDRDRRRRVARAVRKGRAVDDPRDAPYAVAFADASLDWLSWKRPFRPLHLLLVTLVLAELTLTGGWHPASGANRICAREHARLAVLAVRRLGPIKTRMRTNVIEQDALAAFERLHPRSRLQKQFVDWRAYELKLDVWVLGRLELDDRAGAALGTERIRSAREYSRKLARQMGGKACARA